MANLKYILLEKGEPDHDQQCGVWKWRVQCEEGDGTGREEAGEAAQASLQQHFPPFQRTISAVRLKWHPIPRLSLETSLCAGTGRTAVRVKVLAGGPDGLDSVPRTHTVGGDVQ